MTVDITPPAWDPVAAGGVAFVACAVAVLVPLVLSQGNRARGLRWFLGYLALLGGSAAAAHSGWLARFDVLPPPMALMMAAVLGGSLALGLSPWGKRLAGQLPLPALIGVQGFRLPLEVAMHRGGEAGILPRELTWSGYNFDVLTGVAAVGLYAALTLGWRPPRTVLWAWNLWGCACLAAITVVAIASSPMVRAFGDDPAHVNTWVLFLPYVWVPTILVSTALTGHILLTRRLLSPSL
jgi:hypothetical protein